jgi:predicted nucleic acid-binding protein
LLASARIPALSAERWLNLSGGPGQGGSSNWPDQALGTVISRKCGATQRPRRSREVDVLLLDTSAWIEIFRQPAGLTLEGLGGLDEVVTCLPVIQEVLQGFTDERPFRIAREAMRALPLVESPLGEELFLAAADLYRAARRSGATVRSSVDCLIAVCALRHNLEVVHRDRDFSRLASVCGLRQRDIGPRALSR